MATRPLLSAFLLAGSIVSSACWGYGWGSSPTSPTPPEPTKFISYAGVVRDDSGRLPGSTTGIPLAGVRVEILTGPNKGQFVTTGADGSFTLALASGSDGVRASKPGWETYEGLMSDGFPVLGQAPHALWGYVYPPTGNIGVEGVRVDIVSGPNAGKVAFTDASGVYRFDDLDTSDSFVLRFIGPNDQPEQSTVAGLKRNLQSNWRLKAQ